MPRVSYRHEHPMTAAEARGRLQQLMERFAERYRFQTRWSDERRAKVSGRGVRGFLEVGDGFVRIELDLPFILSPLRSRIQQSIAREVSRALPTEQHAAHRS